MTTKITLERWAKAIYEATEQGVVITENVVPEGGVGGVVTSYCIGLIPGDENTPVAFTLGFDQDMECEQGYYFDHHGIMTFYRDDIFHNEQGELETERLYSERPYARIAFAQGYGGGDIVAEAFRTNGFKVEWDGSENPVVILI